MLTAGSKLEKVKLDKNLSPPERKVIIGILIF